MLEKIREKLSEEFESVETFLEKHKSVAEDVIQTVATEFTALDGTDKLAKAIALFLEAVHVPMTIAVFSANKLVSATAAFIQNTYDSLKADKVQS